MTAIVMRKVFIILRCVLSNTLDVVVMKRHASVIGSHTVLRTMIFGAGVIAVLLFVCAGTAAGAADVYVNESGWRCVGGAFNASGTPIQAAVAALTATHSCSRGLATRH